MVTETVVKESLSKEMVDSGEFVTRLLDANNLAVAASFWFFLPDSNVWRLIIASPVVDSTGIRAAYERVQQILSTSNGASIDLHLKDITLVSPTDGLISLLRTAITTGKELSSLRFTGNLINGVLIEDAYIYRLI